MKTYLDYAGIGLVRPAAREAMTAAIDEVLAHGSGEYAQFFTIRTAARVAVARMLDCDPDEVALVANTSTGLQLVADGLAWRRGDEVVVFDGDFPANIQPWRRLEGSGVRLRWVPMRDGGYDVADVAAVVGASTRLIAASHVSFLTGFRLDLDALCDLAAPHGALVCVDAAQSLGVLPLAMSQTRVDFLAAGGHKWLGAPPGTGVLFCRRERLELLNRAPLGWFGYDRSDELFGHGEGHLAYRLQPRPAARRFEGGMLNFVGIAGLAAAVDEITSVGLDAIWARVARLAADLREGLAERGFAVAGWPGAEVSSGIVSFTVAGGRAGQVHAALLERGCQCSYPNGLIRLSPHYWTTDADVARLFDIVTSL